jgi:hypothetical protein
MPRRHQIKVYLAQMCFIYGYTTTCISTHCVLILLEFCNKETYSWQCLQLNTLSLQQYTTRSFHWGLGTNSKPIYNFFDFKNVVIKVTSINNTVFNYIYTHTNLNTCSNNLSPNLITRTNVLGLFNFI